MGWRRWLGRRGVGQSPGDDGLLVVDSELIRKCERLSLRLGRELIYGLMGEHQAQRRTSGIEFADYRQYSPGDDLRRVDWRAYARLGSLHVRQAQAEHDTSLYLLVDSSPSMDALPRNGLNDAIPRKSGKGLVKPSKFLGARRLAAGLGYIALAHLDSVVLATPGASTEESGASEMVFRGRAQAGGLFRGLQELEVGKATIFDGVMDGWSVRRGEGRMAILISDLLLEGYRSGVRRLVGAGYQVMVLHVLSPEELQPQERGSLELVDSETGEKLEVNMGAESLAEYGRRLRLWLEEIEGWCRGQGVGYLMVQSDWDVERVLLESLRRRGVIA